MRLGIIGCGRRVSRLLKTFRQEAPEIELAGVVDPAEEAVRARLTERDREVQFYPGVEELVRQGRPDGLMIGTSCHQHSRFAIEVFRYHVPLFLEKPVAITMHQALQLEEAYSASRCSVMVSFPMRVSGLCRLARDYIADGAVGEPQHIAAVNYVPYGTTYWERGYRDYTITQGLFLQKATHDFDSMSYLMDSPPIRVAAMAGWGRVFGGDRPAGLRCSACEDAATCLESPESRRRTGSGGALEDHLCVFGSDTRTAEGTNEDCSSALVEFASGAHGTYSQVFFARRDAAARGATISGYHGTVSFDFYRNQLRRIRHHAPFSETVTGDSGEGHFGGDIELARDFVALVKEGRPARASLLDGLQSVYACLAAKESAETGQFVAVRQVGAVVA